MPLSEEEQRILGEIEENLRATDPDLARQVGSTTVYTESWKQVRLAVFGFVIALIASILLLTINFMLAFIGFIGMVFAALRIESGIRAMGKTGLNQTMRSPRAGGLRDYLKLQDDQQPGGPRRPRQPPMDQD